MQRPANTLSARESEILGLVSRGLTNKAISVELEISEKTVQNHIANIFHALAATSRTDAVVKAFQMGLLKASS
jgi:DNA-binding NarL/FixJ family response regulator